MPRTAPKTYFIDGICLSEAGLAFIRKQSMRLGEKKRNPSRWKRTHPGLINMHLAGMSSERSEEDVDGLDTKNTNNAGILFEIDLRLTDVVVKNVKLLVRRRILA